MSYSLLEHNTFGLKAEAREFYSYGSEQELLGLLEKGVAKGKYIHIGRGSNLLFLNPVYDGVVLMSSIKGIEIISRNQDEVVVRVGAGETWDDVVSWAVEEGYYGIENLSGVPGQVGAAAVQNIGAYGVEFKDVAVKVETIHLDGTRRVFDALECGYGYRESIFKLSENKGFLVTYVQIRLSLHEQYQLAYGGLSGYLRENGMTESLSSIRKAVLGIRNAKLPDYHITGNAGSFFKNPVITNEHYQRLCGMLGTVPGYKVEQEGCIKVPAGFLIDRAGWKGRRVGSCGVHDKQALVLVNHGGASGRDIEALANDIIVDVRDRYGIELSPEVNFID